IFYNGVLCKRKIAADRIVPTRSRRIFHLKHTVYAAIPRFAQISIGNYPGKEPCDERDLLSLNENAFAIFPKGVYLKYNLASEHFQIKSKVRFGGDLPGHVLITGLVLFNTGHKPHIFAKMVRLSALSFHRCQKEEPDVFTQVVVSDLSERSP